MTGSTPTNPWTLELLITSDGGRSATERRSISRDVERGSLVRLRPGALVARDPFDAMSPEEQHVVRMRAATAVSRRPLVFSHWSAAILHGFPVPRPRLTTLHATTSSADERHRRNTTAHLFALSSAEVIRLGGLMTTTVERTVVDVAGGGPFEEGVMVADAALAAGVPRDALAAAVDLAGLRRASARIDDVIAFGHPGAESATESMLRVTLFRIGVEVPELQRRFVLRGGRSAYLDAFLRSTRIGIETDGDRKYLDTGLAPEGAGRVLLAEKRREDEVRSQLGGLLRLGWQQSCSTALLRPLLERVGVRPERVRPSIEDYAAEARTAATRRRSAA